MIRKSILYRIGHKFGTDNSFVSYWKKYRSYRLYQRNLAVLASKRIPKQRRRKGRRRWRSRAARVALWGNCFFFFFFFFSVGLSVSLFFFFFFFAKPFFLLLLCWYVRLPLLLFFVSSSSSSSLSVCSSPSLFIFAELCYVWFGFSFSLSLFCICFRSFLSSPCDLVHWH